MPVDGIVNGGTEPARPKVQDVPDDEVLNDVSLMKTCGTKETALKCIRMLDKCLETGKLDLSGEDMPEEMLVKTIKAVGKIGGIKGLMPTRTSTLPINEINLSGNSLLTPPSPSEHTAAVKANLKRRAETVQLIVQFVRVSTEARTVIFDNCNLEGYSHDKDDLVELELVRLVKKFGAGKNSRYAERVSLAGNRFGQEFCRRIIEGAYWERNRHPDKDDMPKLFLDLSKNRIPHPERIVEELKEGKTAGGPMSLATTTDPEDVRKEALIILDISGQRDHSPSAPREGRRPLIEQLRQDRQRRPSPRRPSRSPPRRSRSRTPPRRSPSRRRDSRPRDSRRRDSRRRSPPRRSPSRRRSRSDSRQPRRRGRH
ncbi:unnamed protein product [Symbiodinium pilosum]|uniref:Uncharacterized protein n=1 Tax=Symbiodinium pilosum TaxID=2952 RepID=A0A812WKH6_SYMPI|nr:unnamed protein product [Symbiodinium pilosum]